MNNLKAGNIIIFLMLIFACCTTLAQTNPTPEEKKRKQYEKAINYLHVAQTLDSIERDRKNHKYLIVYDGWIFEEALSNIDPAKVSSIEMKRGSNSIISCDYVVIVVTVAAKLRESNRKKRIQLYSKYKKPSNYYEMGNKLAKDRARAIAQKE